MGPVEARILAFLDELGVPYEVVPCDPALADTASFCATYGYALEDSANAIVVVGKSDPPVHAVCVVLATTRLDVNHAVRDRIGVRRVSFASPEQTAVVTGMELGGVTPFALPEGLPVWVDDRVIERPRIVLGGGGRSSKIVGPPELLTAQARVDVVPGLALVPEA
jgi:prolyl-tRNA editing enzyme YbaK/EbsC (Cys-tRNA(Pro) deacylase)